MSFLFSELLVSNSEWIFPHVNYFTTQYFFVYFFVYKTELWAERDMHSFLVSMSYLMNKKPCITQMTPDQYWRFALRKHHPNMVIKNIYKWTGSQ